MGQHLGDSTEEIDLRVYLSILACEGKEVQYVKCNPRDLFRRLGIDYRYNSDLFNSLNRLYAHGNINRTVKKPDPAMSDQEYKSTAAMVQIVALRVPIPRTAPRKVSATAYAVAT